MNQEANNDHDQGLLEEYDFNGGVRGKYVNRFQSGCNVVVLYPDVAKVFTDSESVNQLSVHWLLIQNQENKTQQP